MSDDKVVSKLDANAIKVGLQELILLKRLRKGEITLRQYAEISMNQVKILEEIKNES